MRSLFHPDYFPHRRTPGKAYVYRIFDRATDRLLYVGCTNDPRRRLREHHDLHRYRFDRVRYEVDSPQSDVAALLSERRQIRLLGPRDNERSALR